jgi:hypothetical protein
MAKFLRFMRKMGWKRSDWFNGMKEVRLVQWKEGNICVARLLAMSAMLMSSQALSGSGNLVCVTAKWGVKSARNELKVYNLSVNPPAACQHLIIYY